MPAAYTWNVRPQHDYATRQRIVTRLPLDDLWDDRGPVTAARGRDLGREDIASLLRAGAPRFAVANVGDRLDWIAPEQLFARWKQLSERLLPAEATHDNDGELHYRASAWIDDAGTIVVFEGTH
ncbi:MAG: hypothetical protein ACREMA_01975 [Longimicrobiales bacterium]